MLQELQEQGLKILRATEQLAATGHFAGEDAIAQAYHLLNTSTEYQELLERREQSLHDSIAFFTDAKNVRCLSNFCVLLSLNCYLL